MRTLAAITTSIRTMSSLASRDEIIKSSLSSIISTINTVASSPTRLVAVSKYIPIHDIKTAYQAGQRHFGENYIQELITKSAELPEDIKWHFIGTLQSNKCKVLVENVKNLWVIETIDSEKKARLLENALVVIKRDEALRVFVQVNTSGEERNVVVYPYNCRESRSCS
jgi:pyridoxal phosphate enzyme (YggS family)